METRILRATAGAMAVVEDVGEVASDGVHWEWIDVLVGDVDDAVAEDLSIALGLDSLAFRDAMYDFDLPKVDDLGSQIVIVFHGLHADQIATCSVSCFLSEKRLVTFHRQTSPSLDALYDALSNKSGEVLASAAVLLAVIADTFGRRHLSILSACEDRVEDLVDSALAADSSVVAQVAAIRKDLAVIARSARPQRETLDQLRVSRSPLISSTAKRRLSDAFDVSQRVVREVEAARESLREILDGYRGAETAKATDVTRVLTLVAALFLPITFVTGFYGMNFPNMPLGSATWGWPAVTVLMLIITVLSIRIFIAKGWMGQPRRLKSADAKGLNDAIRAPVQISDSTWQPGLGSIDTSVSDQVE